MAHPHFAPRALIVWIAALALCVVVYVGIAKPGPWLATATELHVAPSSMRLTRGAGAIVNGILVVTGTAQDGNAVISVGTNFAASDYARVAWSARGLPAGVEAALLWNTDVEPSRVNRAALRVAEGMLQPAIVASDPHWIGHIRGLALVLHGRFEGRVAVLGVDASTGDAPATLLARWREWFGYVPWDASSINTVPGGTGNEHLPLPLLLAAALLVMAIAMGAGEAWRMTRSADATTASLLGRSITAIVPAALVAFLTAWFVLDARWQVTLARHVRDDGMRFAGETSAGKHLALDGALFAFVEKARAILPVLDPDAFDRRASTNGASGGPGRLHGERPPGDPHSTLPARVFVLASSDYLRGRAAYQLYPWNVWSDATGDVVPPADRLHSGDWIVVYQRRGVEYDAAAHKLRWDGGRVLSADLKLLDHGGALFELR